jgi:NitT/TauT family transport system permease protein
MTTDTTADDRPAIRTRTPVLSHVFRRRRRRNTDGATDPAGARLRWEIGALIVGIGIWELIGRGDPQLIPPADQVWSAGAGFARSGALWREFGVTLRDLLIGFAVSMVAGVLIGLAMGLNRRVGRIADMYLNWMLAAPEVALIPFYIVVFGYSSTARLLVIVIFALPVIGQRTVEGVLNVPMPMRDMASSFEVTPWHRVVKVVLPATLPSIMVAARLGFSRSLLGVVGAGIFIQEFGLGGQIYFYEQNFDLPAMFLYLVAVIVVALVGSRLIQWLDHRVTRWNAGPVTI